MGKKFNTEELNALFDSFEKKVSNQKIIRKIDISAETLYKYKRLYKMLKETDGNIECLPIIEFLEKNHMGNYVLEYVAKRYGKQKSESAVQIQNDTQIKNLFLHGLDELIKVQRQIAEELHILNEKL